MDDKLFINPWHTSSEIFLKEPRSESDSCRRIQTLAMVEAGWRVQLLRSSMIWWNLWPISKAAKVAVILSLLPVLLCKSQEVIILCLKSTKQDRWRYVSQVLRHDMRCLCGGCVPGSQWGPWTVCMVASLDGREPETIRNAMFFLYWQKVIKLRCIHYMMFIWIMYILMLLSLLYDYYYSCFFLLVWSLMIYVWTWLYVYVSYHVNPITLAFILDRSDDEDGGWSVLRPSIFRFYRSTCRRLKSI